MLGMIGSLVGTGLQVGADVLTNKANREHETQLNEQNIAFQRETNAKNEALMRESWLRDDNAVQRRTKDLEAAGMSPLLAAGSAAGNSGTVSMQSPEAKHRSEYRSPQVGAMLQQGLMQAAALSVQSELAEKANELQSEQIDVNRQQAATAQEQAATARRSIDLQELRDITDRDLRTRLLGLQQNRESAEIMSKTIDALIKYADYQKSDSLGLRSFDSSHDIIRLLRTLTGRGQGAGIGNILWEIVRDAGMIHARHMPDSNLNRR